MPIRRLIIACGIAVAACLAVPAGAQLPPPGERIPAGVTAAGVDVSGLTVDEAAARLAGLHGERLSRGVVTVRAADLTWKLKATTARVAFDPLTSAKRALNAGRAAAGQPVDVPLAVKYSKRTGNRFARRIDRRLAIRARNSQLRISIHRVRVTHSRRGRDIDRRKLAKQIGAALVDPRLPRVLKPKVKKIKPKVNANELRRRANTVITIQQSTFTLRLFKRMRVVRTYRVAVGMPSYPTPRGLFSIASKQVNPVWSAPNAPWAGELAGTTVSGPQNQLKARWMGIVGGVGIHGTALEHTIGTRASHGCIRMRVGDVVALYDRVPVGTPVLIG